MKLKFCGNPHRYTGDPGPVAYVRELQALRLAERVKLLGGDPTKPDPFAKLAEARKESKRKRGLYPPKPKPDRSYQAFLWCLLFGSLYLAAASMAYRFSHPEQTETELFLNLLEAFLWR